MRRTWSPYYLMRAPRGSLVHLVHKDGTGETMCTWNANGWRLEPSDDPSDADCPRCKRARKANA